jgi:hypothetical protein
MSETPVLKVAIGTRPHDGPWGGGNRFVTSLSDALTARGHQVVHDLAAPDIDILLMVDPRFRSPHVSFGAGAALRYVSFRNPKAIVVHRINECDERKGEPFINHKLVRANYIADATVFVGEWLTRLPVWQKYLRSPWSVIRNGGDTRVFNASGFVPWSGTGPIRFVTHHWGYHPMKGFDIYATLDELMSDPQWKAKVDFTYIGQLPSGFKFRNARYVPPLNGKELADELRSHHAYLTGSQNEPGGNHQVEGALCGLPLLYRESGCMPEYCEGFGVSYAGLSDFPAAIDKLRADYSALAGKMSAYPNTSEHAMKEWIALFDRLVAERSQITARRDLTRSLPSLLATQFIY